MKTVIVTDEFEKQFRKLPKPVQKKALKQESLFRENPLHSSLHTEKLNPKDRELWSFRVDKNYRILFRFLNGEAVLFLAVGHHSWIYKINF